MEELGRKGKKPVEITCRNHYALLKWTVNYKQESWKNHLKTKNLKNFFYTAKIV